MKINVSRLLWAIALISMCLAGAILLIAHYQIRHFYCQSEVRVIKDDAIVDFLSSFSFNGGQGQYNTTAQFQPTGQSVREINQIVHFEFWFLNDELIALATDESEQSATFQDLSIYIPSFFLHRDTGIALQLRRMNNNAYLISKDLTPIFYCKVSRPDS